MRLTISLAALASFFLLASGAHAAPATAPSAAQDRASQISECLADPPIRLPAGINANLFCTCTADKTTADGSQHDAIFLCAAEMRFAGPEFRAAEISDCVSGSPGHLPESADANAFCGCAVDKMLTARTPQRDAITQCADELHIALISGLED